MIEKYCDNKIPSVAKNSELASLLSTTVQTADKSICDLDFQGGINAIMDFCKRVNGYVTESEPWVVAKDASRKAELDEILYNTAEDMWEKLGHKPAIANAGWPKIDQSLIGADNVIAILQVNGKIKDRIEVSPNISNAELEQLARENAEIKAALIGQVVKKVITVSPKLVNFVI